VSWSRRWYRAGSAWLLIAAGAHLSAHWRAYVATDAFDPSRARAMEAMQAHVLYAPLGVTLWTALGFFSLAFGVLLAAFGTTHWILAREAEPRVLRRHAFRNAIIGILATSAAAWLHPLPLGLAILGGATLLFALASWPRALDA
jgi:hypothetical protein